MFERPWHSETRRPSQQTPDSLYMQYSVPAVPIAIASCAIVAQVVAIASHSLRTDPSNTPAALASSSLILSQMYPYPTACSAARLLLPGGNRRPMPGGIALTLTEPRSGDRGRKRTGAPCLLHILHYTLYAALFRVGSEAAAVPHSSGSFLRKPFG